MLRAKFKNSFLYNILAVAIDTILIIISFYFTVEFCGLFNKMAVVTNYIHILTTYCAIALLLNYIYEMYKVSNKTKHDIFVTSVLTTIIANLSIVVVDYFVKEITINRIFFVIMPAFHCALILIWRIFLQYSTEKLVGKETLAVITTKEDYETMFSKIELACQSNYKILYFVLNKETKRDAIVEFIAEVSSIMITQSVPQNDKIYFVSNAVTQSKRIFTIPSLYDISILKSHVIQINDIPALYMSEFELSIAQRVLKRTTDIVFSFVGIILMLPLMVIISMVIRMTSHGTVIHTEYGVTVNTDIFTLYTFRTIRSKNTTSNVHIPISDDDPSIIPFGRFLRKTKLYKLPQLFNILIGDMSFVGPKPEVPFLVCKNGKEVTDYQKRHLVKSGLTGYAQVYGRENTDEKDKLLFDLMYIRNYSFLLDVKLMFLSVKTLFMRNVKTVK